MKKRWILLFIVLFIGIFSSSMTGYISGVREFQKSEKTRPHFSSNKSQPEQITASAEDVLPENTETENIITDFEETYILKEHEGRLVLFIRYVNGDEQYHTEYDVSVATLPQADREKLKEGIEVSSYKEALGIAEDYIS